MKLLLIGCGIACIPLLLLLFTDRKLLFEIVLDSRPGRILHYYVVFLFGFFLYSNSLWQLERLSSETWIKIVLFLPALAYAAIFAIVSNNKEDLEIDKISNTNRPLVQENVDPNWYLWAGVLFQVSSLLLSALLGLEFLLTIIGLSLVYFIYSCKPFRLKRFVILAKVLIGLNTLIATVGGFVASGGKILDFPVFWAIFILVPISLMANFVDLKDLHGDKAAGIKTLPVLWGEGPTKWFLSVFILLAYSMVATYFEQWWITALIVPTCIVHLLLLFKKPFQEKFLFVLHNGLFLALIGLVIITGNL